MDDRGHLTTEHRNPTSMQLDRMSIVEAFDVINREDARVAAAVAAAREDICRAIELVVHAFQAGGRLIYVGAGTAVASACSTPPSVRRPFSQIHQGSKA